MKEEIIVKQTCPKCGSTEKVWNDKKGRYDCVCGKKWVTVQKTGYEDNGRKKDIKWWQFIKLIGKFVAGEL